jgi:Fe-S cluster biogenesis protein NfuA
MAVSMKHYIENKIKPKIQADGGEIDFIGFENGVLSLLLQGECSRCTTVDKCLNKWLVTEIKKDLDEAVTIKFIKKLPFFWDV